MDKPIENPSSEDFPPEFFFHDTGENVPRELADGLGWKGAATAGAQDKLAGVPDKDADNGASGTEALGVPQPVGDPTNNPFLNPFGELGLFGDRIFNAVEKNPPKVGSLLVSSPDMRDETFGRTIIYLVQHDMRGTTGVILNQQSTIAVHNVLPEWEPFCSKPAIFYVGGPVEPQAAVGLAHLQPGCQLTDRRQGQHIEGRSYLVNLDANLGSISSMLESFRIYVGYCAWVPGQLADELERGDWYVTNSLPQDFATDNKTDLYSQVLRRQEWPLNLYSTRPIDPKMN